MMIMVMLMILMMIDGFQHRTIRSSSLTQLKLNVNDVIETYKTAVGDNDMLLRDMVTVFGTTTLSDSIAQTTERLGNRNPIDKARLLRFATFGFFDGAVGHSWFIALDSVIRGSGNVQVIEKIALDTLVYTPLWCLWFVVAQSLLKRNYDVISSVRNEWRELAWLDLGFFLPLSCIVYSIVPLESRVTVFAVASVIYTVLVSLWNEQKKNGDTFMTNIINK